MTLLMNYWQLGSFCLTLLTLPYWPKIPGVIWCGPIVIYYLTIIITSSGRFARKWFGVVTALLVIIIFSNGMLLQSEKLYQFGQNIIINVKVNSSFQQNSFGFSGVAQVTHINHAKMPIYLRPTIKLYTPVLLQSGDTAQFQVRLKPIYGQLNEAGMDSESYYFSQGVIGKAFVQSGSSFYIIHQPGWREWLQREVNNSLQGKSNQGIILALTFADRSEISDQQWQWFKSSGLSHLMAISGLHISMAFTFGALLAALFIRLIPGCYLFNLYWLPGIAGLLIASGYSWLADFTLPTQRALTMLVVSYVLQLTHVRLSFVQRMLFVLLVVLVLNPNGSISSSFWLSFVAVVCVSYVMFNQHHAYSGTGKMLNWLMSHILLSVLMIPLLALLFGGISLVSPLYNMLFIPWFSLIVIPSLFLALFVTLGVFPLAEQIWQWVDLTLEPIGWLTPFSSQWWLVVPTDWTLFTCLGIVVYLLRQWVSLSWISLVMVLGSISLLVPADKRWRIDILDIGQGLAVLIEKNGHYLLYDTGPGWSTGSSAEFVITPVLEKRGARQLDTLILSHLDSDHAGGRKIIEQRWQPQAKFSGQSLAGYHSCSSGDAWKWQGLTFSVLWPPQSSNLKDFSVKSNQHSCVIKVTDSQSKYSLLLPGDIEAQAELLMINRGTNLKADIVIAPHHGSRSSSSQSFIDAVAPQYVVASLAKGNRWHFPDSQVQSRYHAVGARWLDTGELGQISFHFNQQQMQITTMRWVDSPIHYVPWYRQMLRKQVE